MQTILTIVQLSRPRFWVYLYGPFFLGVILSGALLESRSMILFWVLSVIYLFIANLFLYGINDYFDQDTDAFNDKKGDKEQRFSSQQMPWFKWILLACVLSVIPLFFLTSLTVRILILVFIAISAAYSAPPFRFKARPFIDSLSNILYLFPGYIAYMHLIDAAQWPSLWILIAGWAWVAAMHLYSAIPDREADKQAGLATSALFFGHKESLLVCALLWAVFLLALMRLTWETNWFLILLGLVYPLIPLWLYNQSQQRIEQVYWLFPWMNTLYGMAWSLVLMYQLYL